MKRHCATRRGLAGLLGLFCVLLAAAVWATAARAQSPVIDLSKAGATAEVIGGFVMVETDKREFPVAKPGSAPGAKDMLVLQARGPGPRFRWILAGIANTGTASRDMAITIPDQGFAGSGLFWPKPPGSRIVSVLAADPLSRFIQANPTIVMLALSFLLMIGMTLIADGMGFHVPKGYVYFAMGFSAGVEILNMLARRRKATHPR